MRGTKGFTMIELMVIMAITLFVLAATSRVLISIVATFKQQSKIAETSIESVVALEILRRDIQSAGFGLATGLKSGGSNNYSVTDWSTLQNYTEAASESGAPVDPASLNDAGLSPPTPPRAFAVATVGTTKPFDGSDHLAIKSASLGTTPAAGKYHTLNVDDEKNVWTPDLDDPVLDPNLQPRDYVMVISLRDDENIGLVEDSSSAGKYQTFFISTSNYTPPDRREVRVVFGIDSNNVPRAPFNRADYYISANNVPDRCAEGTGVLVKASMSHADGAFPDELPLLDCVADFQVEFGLDKHPDDNTDAIEEHTDSLTSMTFKDIREQVKSVTVSALVQEGQMDRRREFVPDPDNPSSTFITVGRHGAGRPGGFDLRNIKQGTEEVWKYYIWRVLSITETPSALE